MIRNVNDVGKPNGLLQGLASLWLGAVLIVVVLVAMAVATIYESTHTTELALATFYMSPWFHGALALLGLNVLAAMAVRFPWGKDRWGFVVTHGSILLILVGALVTKMFGVDGQLALFEGESGNEIKLSSGERVTITDKATGRTSAIELKAPITGMLEAKDVDGLVANLDAVVTRIETILSDSEVAESVVDDGPKKNVAIEVAFTGTKFDEPVWVFEGAESTRVPVILEVVGSTEELARRVATKPADDSSIGTVKVSIAGLDVEYPVKECMDSPKTIGQSGYSVRVLEYFPHAVVGQGGVVQSASDRPVNPAIRVEVTGPSGTQTKTSFSRFPDYGATHAGQGSDDVRVKFVATATASARNAPITVLTGGDGQLIAQFADGSGEPVTTPLTVGAPVATPWPGVTFAVQRRFDRARLDRQMQLPKERGEIRVPAVRVAIDGVKTQKAWVRKGEGSEIQVEGRAYELAYGDRSTPLGFSVTLSKFTVGYYPGGRRPRSFESQIAITDPASGRTINHIVSMNHPTKFGSFRLYQSSYQLAGQKAMSVLSVSRDPGQPIVFTGYFGLMGGMAWVLVNRLRKSRAGQTKSETNGRDRVISLLVPGDRCAQSMPAGAGSPQNATAHHPPPAKGEAQSPLNPPLVRGERVRRMNMILFALLGIWLGNGSAGAAESPASVDALALREIGVQHDGRYMPLDTLARDVVKSVTGKVKFDGGDPVLTLLAWTFEPKKWMNEPLITVANAELRKEIGLAPDRKVFSYVELSAHERLRSLIEGLEHAPQGRKMDPLESKVSGIHEKLLTLHNVFEGQVIRLIPDPSDSLAAWKPASLAGMGGPQEVREAWRALSDAFVASNATAFDEASQKLIVATKALPAAYRPASALLNVELRYNRLSPFQTAWRITLVGAIFAALAMVVRRRWFDVLVLVVLLAGFSVLTYGLSLRWQIAGRIPASNMYESLLFLGWGVGAFAILSMFLFRQRLVPLTAAGMASLALVLADVLPVDSFVRPIAPVLLDTVWMSIHVPIIMVSYSVLALAVLVAHIQVVLMAAAPRRSQLVHTIDGLHYWYVSVGSLLLTAGIITGSMWAAASWGRYWGWDPKEVWSLVALLGYLTILHVRIDTSRTPRWVYVVGAILLVGTLGMVVPKLGPLSTGGMLGISGTCAGIALMVLTRGPFATAAKSIVCFWLIVMTYVGVNYVLGTGLHSYGFGTGAVARYMFLMGGADLGFVAICAAVYSARTWTGASLRPALGFAANATSR